MVRVPFQQSMQVVRICYRLSKESKKKRQQPNGDLLLLNDEVSSVSLSSESVFKTMSNRVILYDIDVNISASFTRNVPSMSPFFVSFKNGLNTLLCCCSHVMSERSRVSITKRWDRRFVYKRLYTLTIWETVCRTILVVGEFYLRAIYSFIFLLLKHFESTSFQFML